MATPAPADKVQDKEYTNWLKVTLALYYMKSGLHTFIQSEIDCLHQSLVQKIYAGQTVTTACIMCNAKLARRKQHTGFWTFQNQCQSSCSTWFYELLALHNNPKSDKIYWSNSDVSLWPFNPWECAKVFLPRGQQPVNTCPAESDAQALMVLLANCKHFHPKLSQQGQTLTYEISIIRNKVMHNGEMKVSDADRMSFIQKVIQFLEDPIHLKSLEDCRTAVSNIHKIDIDSVDVFFNVNQEMTALSSVVKELKLELGMQENKIMDNVDSLKEEYRQLREQLTNSFEDFEKKLELHGENTTKMFEGVEKKLELQVERVRENVVHLHELEVNVELHQQKLGAVEENVEIHEQRLCAVELNVVKLQEEIGQMTMGNNSCMQGSKERKRGLYGDQDGPAPKRTTKQHEFHMSLLGTKGQKRNLYGDPDEPGPKRRAKQQGTNERRRGLYDGQDGPVPKRKTKQQETAPKRRPESDGLKQLKNETEDILDTFRMKGFIQTTQTVEAKTLLQEKRSIVISGNPGEGKTSMAFHLIDNDDYRNQLVVVKSPKDWKKVDTDWVKIVVLEDIFGQYDIDPDCLKEWVNKYLQTIEDHVHVGKLQVIITIRKDILLKAYSKLKSFRLFSSNMTLILSSEKLKHLDKMSILNKELQRMNKDMNIGAKEQCIAEFSCMIGFPQCCFLFAMDKYLFSLGPDFFTSPERFLVDNIRNLETNSFLSLAFLFCLVEIEEEYLSPSQESKKYLPVLEELTKYLHISFDESAMISLRQSYEYYSGLYVKKVLSCQHQSGGEIRKACIQFSHATIYEAVGQVLGDSYPEMVVNYADSGYLYMRTYTAKVKDDDSQNVFIPVSVYGLLVERMVHDVIEKGIVESVVKHSALKQKPFLMKLINELEKGNRIKEFLIAESRHSFQNVSEGKGSTLLHRVLQSDEGDCGTFLQCAFQCDEDAIKLVYSHFMKFLECTHTCNNKGKDCWQCEEKQTLLELALYYDHFEIADQLITMNTSYTHVSLCNAARHGDLNRVQTILEGLKRRHVFSPKCIEAKQTLCRAYLSRSQDVIEILLQEGIILDSMHVVHAAQHGDISVLMMVVEHLSCHNMWHPSTEHEDILYSHHCFYSDQFRVPPDHPDWDNHNKLGSFFNPCMYSNQHEEALCSDPCSKALYITYCNEKFDMADYLLKNKAKVSMKMLAAVTKHSSNEAVARVIQHLKVNHIWDPNCDDASEILGTAYWAKKYDVCDLLAQEGVSMTMKHFPDLIMRSLDYVKTVVQWMKNTDIFDPKCDDVSKALAIAFREEKDDVCDLLIQEGVSLTMKNFPHVVMGLEIALESVKKAVQHLKDTRNWDPKCEDASKALAIAYREQKDDVCDLLIQEKASLTMKNLPHVVVGQKYEMYDLLIQEGATLTKKILPHVPGVLKISLEAITKAVQHLKDTKNWDPKCEDASESLAIAYREEKYDVCDHLNQEGASLTMKNLPHVIRGLKISLKANKMAVQHLKDTENWDPKCEDASKALAIAFGEQKYDVCELLIQEKASLTMKNFPHVVMGLEISLESVMKAVQHLKDTKNWDPKCEDASKALTIAYGEQKDDVCDLLNQEGVSLTMKNLLHVVGGQNYDLCDLKIQEGASLTMKIVPLEFGVLEISLKAVLKAVQHLKDAYSWDPKCEDASKALAIAYGEQRYDVCDVLIQEEASLTMKDLPLLLRGLKISLECVQKAVQHLKDSNKWDPNCESTSESLALAYGGQKYDVCDLLIQEGALLKMKNLPCVFGGLDISFIAVKRAVQHLKDNKNWVPKCDDASKVLEKCFLENKYDVCDLLIQEGASLTMKNLPHMARGLEISLKSVKKSVQHLKDTNNFDPKCEDASKALAKAYREQKYEVCDLLIQEGASLTMKNLPCVVGGLEISLKAFNKAVQNLKDTKNWDPKCKDASKALAIAFREQKYDVCELLIQEGASLTMKNLPCVVRGLEISFKAVKRAVQHLKDNKHWVPKCEDASKVLEKCFLENKYDVCDLLIQEGASLTMKNLPHMVRGLEISLKSVKKSVQHLKDTNNFDPKCEDASKALAKAYREQKYEVCDLLIQEGASLTMKNLPCVVGGLEISLKAFNKAVQNLKDTKNWDPKCKDASKALAIAFREQKYDVCELLIQEGASLTMKNLPCVVGGLEISLKAFKKAVQHLKVTNSWFPKCKDASKALAIAFREEKDDVYDLLIQEGASLTMKNLLCVVGGLEISLKTLKKAVQHLKDTNNWDPNCEDVLKALEEVFGEEKYVVCDLPNQK